MPAGRLLPSGASLQQSPNEPARRKKPKNLTNDDRLIIFWLAIRAGDAYGHMTNKAFWEKVANGFKEATGKEHGTIGRAVEDMTKARRKALAEDKTGAEENVTSLTDAIDQWIDIVDARKELENERQEAQGVRDAETQESINWRNAQLMLWIDKTQPGLAAVGRKRRREESDREVDNEDSSAEGDSGDDSELAGDSTEVSTSVSAESGVVRGRKRRSTKTPRKSSPNNEIPRQLTRLVNILEEKVRQDRAAKSIARDSFDELKARFSSLEKQLNSLEANVSKILSILGRNQ